MTEILLVPSLRKGNGSGHLQRCFSILAGLGNKAAIYLPSRPEYGSWSSAELKLAFPKQTTGISIIESITPESSFKLVVLDNRFTQNDVLEFWSSKGPVAALDESGPARNFADYIIDILPSRAYMTKANLAGLGYLFLPKNRRTAPEKLKRVLVSFGGEDPAGLGNAFLKAATGIIRPQDISVVSGALSAAIKSYPGIITLGPVQDLKEKLYAYDLVVCQFGLTAYEAAWAGCAVLLLSPSRLHEDLGKQAGFVSLGLGKPTKQALLAALSNPQVLIESSKKAAPQVSLNLSEKIDSLEADCYSECPFCRQGKLPAIFRNEIKTYRSCPECNTVLLSSFSSKKPEYTDDSYFFEEYKKQYGRTYIEDIPNIREMAAKRLKIMEHIQNGKKGRLLDIGCAYGAFAAEAQDRGWEASGADISAQAVEYVKKTFNLPAFVADFQLPAADGFYPRNLDCISMWYVIEHFKDIDRVLQRASHLLKPGGLLAFSTPSLSGISGKKNPEKFLEASPLDHYTIWSPKSARLILKRYGFYIKKIRVSGHHPERFTLFTSKAGTIPYKITMLISKLFKLGDTFECYAILKK